MGVPGSSVIFSPVHVKVLLSPTSHPLLFQLSSGNALNWRYKLNLKVKDSTVAVDFDDWMFLQDDNILMNRAEVKKWGIVLGVVSITFKK